jgi:glutamine amidotransferase
MWSCENAKTATPAIASGSFVGHVRLASPGIETCYLNTPLFNFGGHLFTINGELKPWPGALSRELRGRLAGDDEAALRGSTDAEMLGALWHTCLRRTNPADPGGALREAVRGAREAALALGGTVKVNAIVAGPWGFAAARYADEGEPNSLYCLSGQRRWGGAALVASEPLDDGPGWQRVKPSTLVYADSDGLRAEPFAPGRQRHRVANSSA